MEQPGDLVEEVTHWLEKLKRSRKITNLPSTLSDSTLLDGEYDECLNQVGSMISEDESPDQTSSNGPLSNVANFARGRTPSDLALVPKATVYTNTKPLRKRKREVISKTTASEKSLAANTSVCSASFKRRNGSFRSIHISRLFEEIDASYPQPTVSSYSSTLGRLQGIPTSAISSVFLPLSSASELIVSPCVWQILYVTEDLASFHDLLVIDPSNVEQVSKTLHSGQKPLVLIEEHRPEASAAFLRSLSYVIPKGREVDVWDWRILHQLRIQWGDRASKMLANSYIGSVQLGSAGNGTVSWKPSDITHIPPQETYNMPTGLG